MVKLVKINLKTILLFGQKMPMCKILSAILNSTIKNKIKVFVKILKPNDNINKLTLKKLCFVNNNYHQQSLILQPSSK